MQYEEIIKLVQSTKSLLTDENQEIKVRAKGRADFVTQIDVATQEYLRGELKKIDSDVILFSEEQERVTIDPDKEYWILDPIDGTQNFIRHVGMSAVSLAYFAKGDLQFGTIFNPFMGETFHAIRGQGAYVNNQPMQVTENKTLDDSLMAIGTSPYKRDILDSNWAMFKDVFSKCLDIRRCGSAALDLAYVAAGRFDGFFERNLKPWDMAAGILLIEEAGGKVTNYIGQPIDINENADICACNGLINEEVLGIIGKYYNK